jgi:hypothetical protein
MSAQHTPLGQYPGYGVTADGRVISLAHNWRGYGARELAQTPNADGYPSVRLTCNGRRQRIAVYKLVALAFLPPRPTPQHEVRHLDGDRLNSSAHNLTWGTRADNASDRARHGRTSHGLRHSLAIKAGLPKARVSV